MAGTIASAHTLAGCASLPRNGDKVPSYAVQEATGTRLARAVAAALPGEGPSVFRLMPTGDVVYSARLVLANTAERSLDLQ